MRKKENSNSCRNIDPEKEKRVRNGQTVKKAEEKGDN